MIEIPVITEGGVQAPVTPIPPHALAVLCDGTVYRVAETAAEAAALLPPPAPALQDSGQEQPGEEEWT